MAEEQRIELACDGKKVVVDAANEADDAIALQVGGVGRTVCVREFKEAIEKLINRPI